MDYNTFKKKAIEFLAHKDYNQRLKALYYFQENLKEQQQQINQDIDQIKKDIAIIEKQKRIEIETTRQDKQKRIKSY